MPWPPAPPPRQPRPVRPGRSVVVHQLIRPQLGGQLGRVRGTERPAVPAPSVGPALGIRPPTRERGAEPGVQRTHDLGAIAVPEFVECPGRRQHVFVVPVEFLTSTPRRRCPVAATRTAIVTRTSSIVHATQAVEGRSDIRPRSASPPWKALERRSKPVHRRDRVEPLGRPSWPTPPRKSPWRHGCGTRVCRHGAHVSQAADRGSRQLALELGSLRVNAVSAGWVDTPVWEQIASPEVKQARLAGVAAQLPGGRIGHPEDIANAVSY